MPLVALFVLLINFLRAVRKARAKRPRGLCSGCSFVHMQYGATGRNAVFCTFAGGVRAVGLDVLYCTDFRNRNAQPVRVPIGFVTEIGGIEAPAIEAKA
jgi:hypothetical protein